MKVGSVTARSGIRINGFEQSSLTPWEVDEYFCFKGKGHLEKARSQTLLKPSRFHQHTQNKKTSLYSHRPNPIRLKTLQLLPLSENSDVHFRKNSSNKASTYITKNKQIPCEDQIKMEVQRKHFIIQKNCDDSKYERKKQRFKTVGLEDKNTLMFFMEARKHNNIMKREKNIMKIRNLGNKEQKRKTFSQPLETIFPIKKQQQNKIIT